MKYKILAVLILMAASLGGCGGKVINLNPASGDLIYKQKSDFLRKYFYFVTPAEREGFVALATVQDFDKFVNDFWKRRDTDPLTPENEFKDIVDSRLKDIENEIFATDSDILGTRFRNDLRSDLAHVYLLYGMPHYKAKLSEGKTYVDLMVWYYFDAQGKPLFRFLFYQKYGDVRLFRNHMPVLIESMLFDPLISPLKEIANWFGISTSEELYQIWQELELKDIGWAFRSALFEFSYYPDIVMEGGSDKIFGALDPPEPAALTAEKFEPVITGQPEDVADRQFLSSQFNSFIPAEFNITGDGRPSFNIVIDYAAVDWEVKNENVETVWNLRMSFQNKLSKNIKEFEVRLTLVKPGEEVESKRKGVPAVNGLTAPVVMDISLDGIQVFSQKESQLTLREFIDKELEPGTYILNVDLRHAVTKKFVGGWREEIVIK